MRPRDALTRSRIAASRKPALTRSGRLTADFQEYAHAGMVFERGVWSDREVGVRVLNRGIEMAADLGGHRLRTHGRTGSITLWGMKLPPTLRFGLPGTELDRVIYDPLLDGCGAVITGIDEPSRRWGTKVRFALDPVPWRVPWARGSES